MRRLVERSRHHLDRVDVVAENGTWPSASHRKLSECPRAVSLLVLDLAQRLLHCGDVVAPLLRAELVRLVLASRSASTVRTAW